MSGPECQCHCLCLRLHWARWELELHQDHFVGLFPWPWRGTTGHLCPGVLSLHSSLGAAWLERGQWKRPWRCWSIAAEHEQQVAKARGILACINLACNQCGSQTREGIVPLAWVRPTLQVLCPVLGPSLRIDMEVLEHVQSRQWSWGRVWGTRTG